MIRAIGLLGKHKWTYLIALFSCALVDPIYRIAFAFANRQLLNSIELGDVALLYGALYMVGGVLLFHFIVQPITAYYYEGKIYYPIIDIKIGLLQRIVNLPLSYLEAHHSGDLMTRVSDDVDQLQEFYLSHTYDVISKTFWGVGSIVAMFLINVPMALFMIGLGLITAWGNTAFGTILAEETKHERVYLSHCNEKLSDILPGLRVIKSYNLEDDFAAEFSGQCGLWATYASQKARVQAKRASLSFLLTNLSFLGGLSIAAYMVALGRLDLGSALAVIMLQNGATVMFSETGKYWSQIRSSLVGVDRIFEVLDEPEEEDVPASQAIQVAGPLSVTFEDVFFSYAGGRRVLQGFNMQADAGKTLALVGSSGGGKSTIAKLLLGLYRPERGRIRINDVDIHNIPLVQLRDMISYVPQDTFLFADTIMENIRVGRVDATDAEVIEAARKASAHGFISEIPLGYQSFVGDGGSGLSGGQRQRIALARAILRDAPILLLDEATSALDSKVEHELYEVLMKHAQGKTVITVAHRQSAVEWADTVQVV